MPRPLSLMVRVPFSSSVVSEISNGSDGSAIDPPTTFGHIEEAGWSSWINRGERGGRQGGEALVEWGQGKGDVPQQVQANLCYTVIYVYRYKVPFIMCVVPVGVVASRGRPRRWR